jgi:hypothetical protein
MNDRTLNDILKNPVYNGWVLRKGERSPAAWRDSPPVDDALWARIQGLLAARTLRASGFTYGSRRRVHSVQPCPEGVAQKNWSNETWLIPLEAQIAGLRVDDEIAAAIAESLAKPVAAIRRLSEEEARIVKPSPSRRTVDAAKAMDYIRNFAASWAKAKPPTRATMSSRSTRRSSFGVRSLSACG